MKHMFPDSVFWTGWHWTWASAGGALPTATPSSNFALGAREPKIWRGIDSRKGIEEGGILRGLSVRDIGAFAVIFVILYVVTKCIYNLYFHPLAGFPGPRFAAMSNMYKTYMNISGYFHHISYDNHARYGPVVRIAPNLLSFSTPSAQKAIYGHPSPGSPNGPYPWYKGPAYAVDDDLNAGNNLAMVRDPVKHAEMVKMMNGAFSTQALRAQEDLVTIIMDRWIEQVGKYGAGRKQGADLRDGSVQNARGINMAKWYNWVTFDIIGDLAFGEAFGCVEMAKSHFWVDLIFDALMMTVVLIGLQDYPWLYAIGKRVLKVLSLSPGFAAKRNEHFAYSKNAIVKRMNLESCRKDFMSYILENKQKKEIPVEELISHASILVIGGSETTATMLVGTTYYLLKNPSTLAKLTAEVRSKFTSISDITNDSTLNLEYLNAVIQEGLRIFPPVPSHLGRISSGAMVDGRWISRGANVQVCYRTLTRSPQYWKDGDSFIPERWIGVNEFDTLEASTPFSIGPRACIGRNLAYMEMRLVLAKMVWRFDLELMNEGENGMRRSWEESLRVAAVWIRPDLWVRYTERNEL